MSFPTDNETIQGIPSIVSTPSGRASTTPALTVVDVRPHRRLQRLAPAAARRAAATSPAPSPSRSPGSTPRTTAEIERLLADKGATAGRDDRRLRRRATTTPAALAARLIDDGLDGERPRGRVRGLGRRRGQPGRHACPTTSELVHIGWLRDVLAGRPVEAPPSGRRAPVPRQLRGARGVRRGPHPGRPLPRHQLARVRRPTGTAARPAELDHALRALGITADTTVVVYGRDTEGDANEKWPGRRAGQIAATRAALILRYAGRRRRPPARRRLRLVGPRRQSARDRRPASPSSVPEFGVVDPGRARRSSSTSPEAKEIIADPDGAALVSVRTWKRAHRQGQRLQLHRPGRPDQGRRLGQLRHRRVPHAALPERGQHDARLPGDRGQLGRGRDHAPTSGSRSTAAPAGGPARPGSTPTSRAGSGSRSTTAAGSSGARTRSTTRSRSATRRWPDAAADVTVPAAGVAGIVLA